MILVSSDPTKEACSCLTSNATSASTLKQRHSDQVCFDESTFLQLFGKGRKERTIPLWAETVKVLRAWFHELGPHTPNSAFPSIRGKPLSRDGVDYLLKRAIQRAVVNCPSLTSKKISPHLVRHYLPFLTISCSTHFPRFSWQKGELISI